MRNKQLIHEYRRMKLALKSLIRQPRSGVEYQRGGFREGTVCEEEGFRTVSNTDEMLVY